MNNNQYGGRSEGAHASAGRTSQNPPIQKAGVFALRQYKIDLNLTKAQRLAQRLHKISTLFPDDRELLIQLQHYLKVAKVANNYEPNVTLDLFPP